MPPQFLVVGHVVQDLISPGDASQWRLGGTASYAAVLGRSLGLRTAVLTAAAPEIPLSQLLPGIELHVLASPSTTQIRNIYDGGHRRQQIPRRAAAIGPGALPEEWRATPIVLLGPVAGEVDGALAGAFPGSLVGVGAQGWLREIAPDGWVRPVAPERWRAAPLLRSARALFVSDEDLPAEATADALREWSALTEIVAFTHGDRGAEVCLGGEWRRIEAFPARTVDPTGAGDVFAAAFLIRLHETGDVWEAARYGACAASFVVEGEGTAAIPDRDQIEERLAAHPQIAPRPA
ncbi:MAG TPA: PfkB family carbohydrate kinase [Dehalococcoidia bacterium]|nr:PfkB family carbohydrate kinase [Dehalococcoidia bacterium]